jgi:pyruvate/2-oxoglutarate dehydrogenase complex dihydrolipoamide acyltransferase (E2) component
MPKVADSVDTVTVIEWVKKEDDSIAAGEILLHVETDKAVVEVPCPVAGVIRQLLVELDADVTTGTPIAVIETS